MAIRFACSNCRQSLQIAARKAGTQIKCPKCQTELTVPAEVANHPKQSAVTPAPPKAEPREVRQAIIANAPAKAAVSKTAASAKSAEPKPSFSSLKIEMTVAEPKKSATPNFAELVFDDIPAAVNTPPMTNPSPIVEVRKDAGPASNVVVDRSLVAISRTVLYAQAILIGVVAVAAFGIGYFAGRGVRQPTPDELMAQQHPVAIEGDVVYRNDAGADTPDAGAVVIAVPHGAAPGQKFSIAGLRPADAPAADGAVNVAIQAVESEGGACARANETGQFTITVRPGKYWVLTISANASRPNGVLPTIRDVRTLGRYFEGAADLLTDRRYALTEQQLPNDAPLEIALDAR